MVVEYATYKGYPVIITMLDKMSLVRVSIFTVLTCLITTSFGSFSCLQEKEVLLRALGAEVVRAPDEEPWDSPNSYIGRALWSLRA